MPDKNHNNLPNKIIQGKTNSSQEAKAPGAPGSLGGGNRIDAQNAKWADIKWTPKKLGLVVAFLSIPYLLTIIGIFKSGNTLVAGILIFLAVLIGSFYLLLRWIESADF